MIINIIGLGLIGGSFCKSVKKNTVHKCYGYDINRDVVKKALSCGVIDGECTNFSQADLTVVCLYPEGIIEFIKENCKSFKKGSIVIDTCGVKLPVTEAVREILADNDITFVGTHPMAGREFSGFEYSDDSIFDGASFIITPDENTLQGAVEIIEDFARSLGFGKIAVTTPKRHDEIIAYTSQLAHVVSNAYIKSPTLKGEFGFSAGSFKDLTRVARLNEDMWTSLFMLNREPLLFEIDEIIKNLSDFRKTLYEKDYSGMHEILKTGRILKEQSENK